MRNQFINPLTFEIDTENALSWCPANKKMRKAKTSAQAKHYSESHDRRDEFFNQANYWRLKQIGMNL